MRTCVLLVAFICMVYPVYANVFREWSESTRASLLHFDTVSKSPWMCTNTSTTPLECWCYKTAGDLKVLSQSEIEKWEGKCKALFCHTFAAYPSTNTGLLSAWYTHCGMAHTTQANYGHVIGSASTTELYRHAYSRLKGLKTLWAGTDGIVALVGRTENVWNAALLQLNKTVCSAYTGCNRTLDAVRCPRTPEDLINSMAVPKSRADVHAFATAILAIHDMLGCVVQASTPVGVGKMVECASRMYMRIHAPYHIPSMQRVAVYTKLQHAFALSRHLLHINLPQPLECTEPFHCCIQDSLECCEDIVMGSKSPRCLPNFAPCVCAVGIEDSFLVAIGEKDAAWTPGMLVHQLSVMFDMSTSIRDALLETSRYVSSLHEEAELISACTTHIDAETLPGVTYRDVHIQNVEARMDLDRMFTRVCEPEVSILDVHSTIYVSRHTNPVPNEPRRLSVLNTSNIDNLDPGDLTNVSTWNYTSTVQAIPEVVEVTLDGVDNTQLNVHASVTILTAACIDGTPILVDDMDLLLSPANETNMQRMDNACVAKHGTQCCTFELTPDMCNVTTPCAPGWACDTLNRHCVPHRGAQNTTVRDGILGTVRLNLGRLDELIDPNIRGIASYEVNINTTQWRSVDASSVLSTQDVRAGSWVAIENQYLILYVMNPVVNALAFPADVLFDFTAQTVPESTVMASESVTNMLGHLKTTVCATETDSNQRCVNPVFGPSPSLETCLATQNGAFASRSALLLCLQAESL